MYYNPKHESTNDGQILLKDCTLYNIVEYLAEREFTQVHAITNGNVQLLINHTREASSCGKNTSMSMCPDTSQ